MGGRSPARPTGRWHAIDKCRGWCHAARKNSSRPSAKDTGSMKAEIQRANNALSGRKGASFPPMCTAGHEVDVFKPYSYVGYADAQPQHHS